MNQKPMYYAYLLLIGKAKTLQVSDCFTGMSSYREGNRVATHVPGFDEVTGGGMPKSSAIVFYGKEDVFKGMLIKQICWNMVQEGGKVLYCTVDRPVEDVRNDMASHGWHIESSEESDKFRFVDVYSDIADRMERPSGREPNRAEYTPASGFFARTVLNRIYSAGIRFLPIISLSGAPSIAVVDSLSPLFSTGDKDTRLLLNALRDATRLTKSIGIGVINSDINEAIVEDTTRPFADGLVKITPLDEPSPLRSIIEIVKYSGQHERGPFPLDADQGGLRVVSNKL